MEQQKNLKSNGEIILYNRSTVLTRQMLGLKLQVYNGIRFFPLNVNSDVIGHRVGEFAPTRKKPIFKKKNQK
jgi:small subunit ribosomal protein S19